MVDGVIIPVNRCSCITVDFWGRSHLNVLAAFLTHAHADHVQGLNTFWNGQIPIYCSYATSILIRERFPVVQSPLFILSEDTTELLSLVSPVGTVHVHVRAYNANHCLGSLMLLFEGPFGRILHTGDFRWEADYAAVMLRDEALTWAPLDKLYIDNTYAHPRYDFPPRAEACRAVLDIVRAHGDKAILIGIDKLGKEELLAAVAAATGERVCVPAERWALLEMLGLPAARLFTTDAQAARIHAVLRHSITVKQVALLNRRRPTIAILPSGFSFYNSGAKASKVQSVAAGSASAYVGPVSPMELEQASHLIFQVPYSLHCNFSELRSFVAALRPRQLVATVSHGVEADINVGLEQLCSQTSLQDACMPASKSAMAAKACLPQRKPSPLAAVPVQADCFSGLEEGNQSTAALRTLPAAEMQQQGVVASAPDALGTGRTELIGNGACHGHSSWQALYWNLCALRSQSQGTI